MNNLRYNYWVTALALFALMLGSFACDSGDGSSNNTTPDVTSQPDTATPPVVTAESCEAGVSGMVETTLGSIDYASGTVSSSGQHLLDEGCVTEMTLQVAREGGCTLDLTLSSVDGAWSLSAGTLTVDEHCGLSSAETSHGEYTVDAASAKAALVGAPGASESTDAVCLDATNLTLLGKATLGNGSDTIEVNFNDLKFSGVVFSAGTGTGTCPADAVACASEVCGSDEYGVQCGSCELGYDCNGGQCTLDICPPPEPYGTEPYLNLRDLTVFDCDGKPVNLHDLCGKPVGFFNLLAGW